MKAKKQGESGEIIGFSVSEVFILLLFVLLLAFAGVVYGPYEVINGLREKISDDEKKITAILAQNTKLEEQLAKLTSPSNDTPGVTVELIDQFKNPTENRNVGPPPCWLDKGKPVPFLRVVSLRQGLRTERAWPKSEKYEDLANTIPKLSRLASQGSLTMDEFETRAGPVYASTKRSSIASGDCRHYVEFVADHKNLDIYRDHKEVVESYFNFSNSSDILIHLRKLRKAKQ